MAVSSESRLVLSQARGAPGPAGDVSTAQLTAAIDALKGGVVAAGDTLAELYALILLRATIAGPVTYTGDHNFPTQSSGNNTTKAATTAFVKAAVDNAIAALLNSAPGALNTLDELAAALGDDANFASTVTTALAGKQPVDAMLTALAALATVADRGLYFTGADAPALFTLSAFARTLLDDADAATARATLELVPGTNVQSFDADLSALAALTGTDTIYYRSGANTWTAVAIGGMLSFSGGTLNIGDLELAALAGLTSAADKIGYFTGSGTAALADFIGGAWTSYSPTVTMTGGSGFTSTNTGRYIKVGRLVVAQIKIQVTALTSPGANLQASLPFNVVAGVVGNGAGTNQTTNKTVNLALGLDAVNAARITLYDGTFPVANGEILWVSGFYEAAS